VVSLLSGRWTAARRFLRHGGITAGRSNEWQGKRDGNNDAAIRGFGGFRGAPGDGLRSGGAHGHPAEPADGMQVITNAGACPEESFAYASAATFADWWKLAAEDQASVINDFCGVGPSNGAFAEAGRLRLRNGFRKVGKLSELKKALQWGSPVVMSMDCYSSMEGDDVSRTGRLPVPNPKKEQNEGGHAVCAVGFDDHQQMLIVRNSWGTEWRGY
jgi:C1A family cysteine protease